MAYVLRKKGSNTDGKEILYWNRRKKVWCSYWDRGSVYPTHKGARRMFRELAIANPGEWIKVAPI